MSKLNLGCGLSKKEGYINIDKDEKVNPDIITDITITPWIWITNDIERIEMNNLAEHIIPFIEVVQECHHVLKNKGILWIKVPLLKTKGNLEEIQESISFCFSDPTHVRYFTTRSFEYFNSEHSRWQKFGQSYGIPNFKLVKQQIKDIFLIVELEAIK